MDEDLADAVRNEIAETMDVEPGGTLYIDLDTGAVEVTSHDENVVRLEATARGWASWSVIFDVAQAGNDVRLTGESGMWGAWLFGPRVRVRAWVPREYSLDARTRGGRIVLAGLSGQILAETSGGAVELRGAQGAVALHTSGGSMSVAEVEGNVRVDTSGGAITIANVIGDVQAATSGGRIEIRCASGHVGARTSGGRIDIYDAGGDVDATTSGGGIFASFIGAPAGSLESSGGGIEIRFPKDAGATLDAETSGGRVDVQHDIRTEPGSDRHHVAGMINGGGAPLRARTSGGNIHVRPL